MHLHRLPVMGKQYGTQGMPVPHGVHRVLLPTKTSQAFSQFPGSSPFYSVSMFLVVSDLGHVSVSVLWLYLVVYSIVYMLCWFVFFFFYTRGRDR